MTENEPELGKIIAKAWRDPAFKAALIANPAAALKAEGFDVPAGMTVTVVENTDQHFHLVLPPAPTDELSDEALDAVAGGWCGEHLGRNGPSVYPITHLCVREWRAYGWPASTDEIVWKR